MKQFIATRAFIEWNQKILILRESGSYEDGTNQGKYDVPGGRIGLGENVEESLRREVKEESGLDIIIKKPFYVGEWNPIVREEQWQIIGIFFRCQARSTNVVLSKDHDAFEWIEPRNHDTFPLMETLIPAFKTYMNKENFFVKSEN